MEKNNSHNTIVVFAKIPGLGLAKSRIAQSQGQERALEIYNELLIETAKTVSGLPFHVSYTGGDTAAPLNKLFPNALSFFPQEGMNLGERMRNAFVSLFKQGYKHVCAIGADCPTLDSKDIATAFFLLSHGMDTVIGPSYDGGYYLLACNEKSLPVFSAKKWSSKELLDETMDILNVKSLAYHLLKPKSDIDHMEDYNSWKQSQKR